MPNKSITANWRRILWIGVFSWSLRRIARMTNNCVGMAMATSRKMYAENIFCNMGTGSSSNSTCSWLKFATFPVRLAVVAIFSNIEKIRKELSLSPTFFRLTRKPTGTLPLLGMNRFTDLNVFPALIEGWFLCRGFNSVHSQRFRSTWICTIWISLSAAASQGLIIPFGSTIWETWKPISSQCEKHSHCCLVITGFCLQNQLLIVQ